MVDVLAVGDVMLDVHVPAPYGHRLHAPVHITAGGSAVNVALAVAELGGHAAVAGCVGDDAAGHTVRTALDEHGVDTYLATAAGSTGTTVYVGGDIVADRGVNTAFQPARLPEARATVVSGYLEAGQLATALDRATGLRVVDLQGQHHELPRLDVVLGPGIDLEAYDADVVCSTLGPDGAVARRGGEVLTASAPAFVADPLRGAGDRFAASFLLGLLAGDPLQECLSRACEFATRTPSSRTA